MSSNREPMWFCHECHAEMRPLMIPDPHCASCRGTFVEMMDNESDDPRQNAIPLPPPFFGNEDPHRFGDGRRQGGMGNILDLLSSALRLSPDGTGEADGDARPQGGINVVINGPMGMRTIRMGGGSGGNAGEEGNGGREGVPRLSEFISAQGGSSQHDDGTQNRRPTPMPMLATYLLSNLLGGRAGGMGDPFEMMANGRFGDYAVNEEALQNILNELMANGGPPTNPPASEEVIADLPRVVLEEGDPVFNETCYICQEPFNPALAVSSDEDRPSSSSKSDTKVTDDVACPVGVTLPCKHSFHEDCILPWLRLKSTCPVCRNPVSSTTPPEGGGSNASGGTGNDSPQPPQSRPSSQPQRETPHSNENNPPIPGAWDNLD